MSESLERGLLEYIASSEKEVISLIEALCAITAPSNDEGRRAEFCKSWLENNGARGVYIDEALNTVYPIGCENSSDIVVFMAHTDTVFPDTEPMPFSRDGEYIYSPGVGDDTASLAVLLTVAKYIAKSGLEPKRGVLIVANSGEEGLGNLKGVRRIMKDYEGRICALYSFDAQYNYVVNKCVGSHRYRVSVSTEGGHSFSAFGNRNAIHAAAELICRLYQCDIPMDKDSKTTYNVGMIEGGTSVNTIAQSASFLYEYRSDSAECLDRMRKFFFDTVGEFSKDDGARVDVCVVGERPCAGKVDEQVLAKMTDEVIDICTRHSKIACHPASGSTDSNIPMSLGVPSVTLGVYLGDGSHTREERVLIRSISVGLKIAFELVLKYFEK